ncbi:DHHC zinc finger domain-containing protein [Toxoplasma gondii VAND]|uniref:DHHC zinc finger domain-containing protein n=1 Tax=Toxoplasma gondii VAND TaxID=933077 RepID=A0A086QGQ8_TOXGO|nr:DHHC zinc finger domain-containing protein [Toxoplasma gondii VAND]
MGSEHQPRPCGGGERRGGRTLLTENEGQVCVSTFSSPSAFSSSSSSVSSSVPASLFPSDPIPVCCTAPQSDSESPPPSHIRSPRSCPCSSSSPVPSAFPSASACSSSSSSSSSCSSTSSPNVASGDCSGAATSSPGSAGAVPSPDFLSHLFLLLRCNKGKAVKAILKRMDAKFYTNVRDAGGHTLLHWAALCGETAVMRLLLANGADPDARSVSSFQSPLMWSVIRDNVVAMRLLFEALESPPCLASSSSSASRSASSSPSGSLSSSSVSSSSSSAGMALGASVGRAANARKEEANWGWRGRDSKGATCAILAAQHNSLKALLLLVKKAGRRCLDETDENGCSPAHWAAFKNRVDVLRLLHYLEADFTSVDVFGCLALHRAVEAGQLEACRVLVEECHVSKNERNTKSNVSAVEIAESLVPPRPDLVAYLRAPNPSRASAVLPLLDSEERGGDSPQWHRLRRVTNLCWNCSEPVQYKWPAAVALGSLLLMLYTAKVVFSVHPSMHSSLFPVSSPWDSHAGPHSSLPFSAASPAPRDVYEGDGAAAQLTSNSRWPSLTGGASVCAFLRLFLARGDLLFWVVCVDLALYLLLLLSDPGIHPKRKRGSSAVEELMEILSSPETHADTLAALDLSRLCRTCWIYRPLRTKHCSICDRCMDGFDHHCVWLYNCVGSLNARLFTAWLLLHSLTQFLHLLGCLAFLLLGPDAGGSLPDDLLHQRHPRRLLILLVVVLHLFSLCRLSVLVSGHLRNIAQNITANEVLNRGRYAYLWEPIRGRGDRLQGVASTRKSFSPFSAGIWKNCLTFWLGQRTLYSASASNALQHISQLFPPASPSSRARPPRPTSARSSRLFSLFSRVPPLRTLWTRGGKETPSEDADTQLRHTETLECCGDAGRKADGVELRFLPQEERRESSAGDEAPSRAWSRSESRCPPRDGRNSSRVKGKVV